MLAGLDRWPRRWLGGGGWTGGPPPPCPPPPAPADRGGGLRLAEQAGGHPGGGVALGVEGQHQVLNGGSSRQEKHVPFRPPPPTLRVIVRSRHGQEGHQQYGGGAEQRVRTPQPSVDDLWGGPVAEEVAPPRIRHGPQQSSAGGGRLQDDPCPRPAAGTPSMRGP